MASDEGWRYARTQGASACSTTTAPVTDHTDAAESATSLALHDGEVASSSSFLADDPHMDWTPAYICMGGTAAAVATKSFHALLQLHGGAGSHFLPVQAHYDVDGTAPAAAAPRFASLFAVENQYPSSATARSCGNMPAAAMMKPFPQHQQPILSQAPESKRPKQQFDIEGVREDCSSVSRTSSVPGSLAAAKKPRIETPSPLPTFKVRKEKLGDRITALQQLVSPFGKTDTASVLHEAIEYIKFLHGQVASLTSPYLMCGRPVQLQKQQSSGKAKDLRSRGLCLVPAASTYTLTNETEPEFWRPTFGGTFG